MNIILTIYTTNNVLEFEVKNTGNDFIEQFIDGMEQGTVALTLVDDSTLVINSINCVAVEIKSAVIPPT